ncbi:sigma-70 family RNA polymerase sigma factor [Kibdelosporangium persicum]|uniref:RNA polymerase sigma factor SigJ n=1 Tax=Kibdelosporangium persicum TaxID=2698649 RepID=A0ABX2FIG0_9PSEU|nr:sigma-70 family RNA polymerase sigma factor [Kibdelosporangium persicum]NRN71196.1 RNA polymerase sigma factor SigJ [Kibdelosporangium persicum]
MEETEWLAERFEQHRPRLRAVAYRMLGSLAEADDAVQDAWLRLSRSDPDQIDNLAGWLTTVVARECLHMLRSRRHRREESFAAQLPDPVVVPDGDLDPEQEALLADSVGLALLVVLDRLGPAERLAFVLHDMFALPFEEIAGIVGRTPAAARQLASRARRRVTNAEVPLPGPDLARQQQIVDAFYAAARAGDFDALVQVLDPDIVLTTDYGPDGRPAVTRGAAAVAQLTRAPRGGRLRPVLVNGAPGAMVTVDGQPVAVLVFTVVADKIVAIDTIREPGRVCRAAAVLAENAADTAVTSPAPEGSQG